MKKKIKIATDIIMYITLLLLMSQYKIAGLSHEYLGIAFGVMLVVHIVLNRKWFFSLFKGRYTPLRGYILTMNLLLTIFALLSMVSGMLVSQHLFAFASGSAIGLGRKLHLASTAWLFVITSMHVGMHIKFNLAMRLKKPFRIIFFILLAMTVICGISAFIERKMWEELFLLIEFQKSYDERIGLGEYMLQSLTMTVTFAIIASYIKAFLIKAGKKNEKN